MNRTYYPGMTRVSVFVLLTILFAAFIIWISPAHANFAGQDTLPEVTPITDVIPEFAALVESEMAFYGIPGMAVAVVQGDEIVYANGFGLRDLENALPFTSDTQFLIGSTTKSMTSMLIAQSVDQGLLEWDTPVTDIFPDFRTANDELTAQMTLRDLMSMGTGLESDTVSGFYWGEWSVDSILDAVGQQQIAGDFRDHYAYNNEVYALAGYAAAAGAGQDLTRDSYAALVQEHIFDPIGMTSAVIADDLPSQGGEFAYPYETPIVGADDTPTRMSIPPIGIIAPSGAVWTTVEDMARYVITQKNGGVTPEGERIVSEESLAETWVGGVTVDFPLPGVTDPQYAMGWVTLNYNGIPIRYHDGGWSGYATQMVIFPDADTGLILFANSSMGTTANYALSFAFAEMLYGLEAAATEAAHTQFEDIRTQLAQVRELIPEVTVESEAALSLVGMYDGGWEMEYRDDSTLWLSRGAWSFQLAPLPEIVLPNTYLIINNGAAGTLISVDQQDDAVTLTVQLPESTLTLTRQDS